MRWRHRSSADECSPFIPSPFVCLSAEERLGNAPHFFDFRQVRDLRDRAHHLPAAAATVAPSARRAASSQSPVALSTRRHRRRENRTPSTRRIRSRWELARHGASGEFQPDRQLLVEQARAPPGRRRRHRTPGPTAACGRRPPAWRPSARALMASVPRRKPLSTMIGTRPWTASTISGSASIVARPSSSWRPPWLETQMKSTPCSIARRASVGGQDALQPERQRDLLTNPVDVVPGQAGLRVA